MKSEPSVSADSRYLEYELEGQRRRTTYTFYRGETTSFHPSDDTFAQPTIISEYIAKGLMPKTPFVDSETPIVTFGSCFASHIGKYLAGLGYNVTTRKKKGAYVSLMGDGIVNSFAIRQQFEWAWENRRPTVELWHGYDANAFGYDEDVRLATKALFDQAHHFIITYGLAEVWYDEPTGEVFWRAVPFKSFDPSRHKFRVSSHAENVENIARIHQLIRRHRPDASLIQTLSPIALTATFRSEPCIIANAASKAILRAALDEFHRGVTDDRSFYFPSYEIALNCFKNHLMEDRKHVHEFVLDFNMKVFERYFCRTGLTDQDVLAAFRHAQELDDRVAMEGHQSVPRSRAGPMGRPDDLP